MDLPLNYLDFFFPQPLDFTSEQAFVKILKLQISFLYPENHPRLGFNLLIHNYYNCFLNCLSDSLFLSIYLISS